MSQRSMNARSSSSIVVAHEALVDPVGDTARVESSLERAAALVVDARHEAMMVARGRHGKPAAYARLP